jgi:hypothetical protein
LPVFLFFSGNNLISSSNISPQSAFKTDWPVQQSKRVLRVVRIELFEEVWNDFSLQISNVTQNQKIKIAHTIKFPRFTEWAVHQH